ncbi:YajG family lipoprotein [Bacterioplanoides sp.]|uniref:YajG family lipoprotein n=1 Tax=Bacterioplanoides sp. TaxID=2066072 RepID=UPI003AFFF4DE
MHKLITAAVMVVGLSGCVLSPQVIELNDSYVLPAGQVNPQRDALIRVIDQRDGVNSNQLGHRGGRKPQESPLLAQNGLNDILTSRLQDSMTQLGFGGSGPLTPVKLQLDINTFAFSCNEGVIVNECNLTFKFLLTAITDEQTFRKTYGFNETRGLAASPSKSYNQQWLNESLDKVWERIFTDVELLAALNVE